MLSLHVHSKLYHRRGNLKLGDLAFYMVAGSLPSLVGLGEGESERRRARVSGGEGGEAFI